MLFAEPTFVVWFAELEEKTISVLLAHSAGIIQKHLLSNFLTTLCVFVLCPDRGRKVLENRNVTDEERIGQLEKELEETIYLGEEADHKFEEVTLTAWSPLNWSVCVCVQNAMDCIAFRQVSRMATLCRTHAALGTSTSTYLVQLLHDYYGVSWKQSSQPWFPFPNKIWGVKLCPSLSLIQRIIDWCHAMK